MLMLDTNCGERKTSQGTRLSCAALISLSQAGCSTHGAPSFTLFGAFLPGWMFCAAMGILAAIAARMLFVTAGLGDILPYQLFVCSSIGLITGLLAWLVWFGLYL
jgi:hypothetical protein